jgi:ParB family chromosome partitioning protein
MAKKIALGKGIASLIQDSPNEILKANLKETEAAKGRTQLESNPLMVNVKQIITNPNQPRKIFKERELEELSKSIKENGIIQPLIVVQQDGNFELVAGERRLKAAMRAGLDSVPVIVKRATDREKMIMSIIENVQRSDLNCVEEALAYYQLMDEFKLTQEEVGAKLGKERSTVANFLRVLKLPRAVVEMLQKELLSFGHAKVLAAVKDREVVIRLANEAIVQELSVRELEKLAKSYKPKSQRERRKFISDDKMDSLRENLEQKTGYHFGIKTKANGAGEVQLKFSNEAEFNDIYEFLLRR